MKKLLSLILCIVCFLAFVSCGETPTGGGKTQLTISVFNGGYNVQWLDSLKSRFESQHEDVEIKIVEAIGNTGRERQIIELKSGETKTDIYFCSNDIFLYVKDADLEVDGKKYDSFVLDLTDVYNHAVTGGTVKDVMFDGFEEFYNLNGKYYALPWASAVEGIMYHEKMFNDNKWDIPRTTNELVDLAKTIKNAELVNEFGSKIFPFSYSLEDEYWNLMLYPWIAQYEGMKGWNDYWAGIDDEGNLNTKKVLDFIGLKRALTVMETILKDSSGFQHSSSKSKDFTSMQYRFLDNESVMVPNGDWLVSEMKEGFSKEEIENLDVKFMKTPIISSLSETLSYYKEDVSFDELSSEKQKEYDQMLSTIIADVDAGKESSLVGNADDFARVKEARAMVASEGNVHIAVVPSYSEQSELAKEFLKMMYSEEGAKIFAENTLGCRLPMNYGFTTGEDVTFAKSVMQNVTTARWIFKYNYKSELFVDFGLRVLAPNVGNFVQLLGASNSNDYKGANTIYNESKTYFENRWDEMVK